MLKRIISSFFHRRRKEQECDLLPGWDEQMAKHRNEVRKRLLKQEEELFGVEHDPKRWKKLGVDEE